MSIRHLDFERIYHEFCSYYKDKSKGESEYYDWLKTLELDESREYGFACESFRWAKDMLQFCREDTENKYYNILLGFPLKSMNGNVYRERDLIAAALSLKGKHPSLNHKDEFWFKPENKYGTLTIVGAKYEDGAIEARLQVPKDAVCPICDGALMTKLIDDRRIVNVSLEGDCLGGICYDGTCEGFTFTDPPFTLLTSDVLPGIPLARIKPLEAYLPFSRVSNYKRKKTMKKRRKIKPKIIEDTPSTATMVQPDVNVNTRSLVDPNFKGTFGTPIQTDDALHSETQSSGNVNVPVGTSPGNYQMKSGTTLTHTKPTTPTESVKEPFADYANHEDCVAQNQDKDDPDAYCNSIEQQAEARKREQTEPEFADHQGPYAPMDGPPDDEEMPKPEDIRSGPPKTKPPEDSDVEMPEGAPADLPSSEHTDVDVGEVPAKDKVNVGDAPVEQSELPPCPEDEHRDAEGNCVPNAQEQDEPCPEGKHKDAEGNCVPDAPTEQDETPCPEGKHKDDEGNCIPDEAPAEYLPNLEERRKAISAGLRAASSDEKALKWEEKHNEVYNRLSKLTTRYHELNRLFEKAKVRTKRERDTANQKIENTIVRMERLRNKYDNLAGEKTDLETKYAQLNTAYKSVHTKYQEDLDTNLTLSKKLTKANEDYLDLAKAKEVVDEKFKRVRHFNKKAVKIKI